MSFYISLFRIFGVNLTFDDQKLPLLQAVAEFCLKIATGKVVDTGFMLLCLCAEYETKKLHTLKIYEKSKLDLREKCKKEVKKTIKC